MSPNIHRRKRWYWLLFVMTVPAAAGYVFWIEYDQRKAPGRSRECFVCGVAGARLNLDTGQSYCQKHEGESVCGMCSKPATIHIALSPYAGHYCTMHGEAARRADQFDEPLAAEIIFVDDTETLEVEDGMIFKTTRVTLNVGTEHGVLPGLSLELVEPAIPGTLVQVIASDKQTAEARIIQFKRTEKEIETPAVGWKLSTRT